MIERADQTHQSTLYRETPIVEPTTLVASSEIDAAVVPVDHYVAVAAWPADSRFGVVGATPSLTLISTGHGLRAVSFGCTQVLGSVPGVLWCLDVSLAIDGRMPSFAVRYSDDEGVTWHGAAHRLVYPVPALLASPWFNDTIIYSENADGAFWIMRADAITQNVVFERVSSRPPNIGRTISFFSRDRLCRAGADVCRDSECSALNHILNCVDGPAFSHSPWYAAEVPTFNYWASSPNVGWWGGDKANTYTSQYLISARWERVPFDANYSVFAVTTNRDKVFFLTEAPRQGASIFEVQDNRRPTFVADVPAAAGPEYADFNANSGLLAIGSSDGVFVLDHGRLVRALPGTRAP